MTTNFYLDNGYITLHLFHKGFKVAKSVIKIDVSLWNKRTQRLNETKCLPYQMLNSFLDDIEAVTSELFNELKRQRKTQKEHLKKALRERLHLKIRQFRKDYKRQCLAHYASEPSTVGMPATASEPSNYSSRNFRQRLPASRPTDKTKAEAI